MREKGRDAVVGDLTACRERLMVSSVDCADEPRRAVLQDDVAALDDLIADIL